MSNAHNVTYESVFQADIVTQMQVHGWQLGSASGYQRETALYEKDALDFVKATQPYEWDNFCRIYPLDSD